MALATPASTLDNLSRLAAKPGVQSTLILSNADGSIIRSSGLLTRSLPPAVANTAVGSDSETPDLSEGPKIGTHYEVETNEKTNEKYAEDVAKMVFSFVSGVGGLVQGMDDEDEVKLLRIRTRKSEIVIVPDSKFLLVVIHDTPQA